MKIVFLAPFGIRPKGTVIARMLPLAAGLQAMGHKVVIVSPPYTNPEDSGKTEICQGVTIRNVVLPSCGKAASAPILAWRMFQAALKENPSLVHLFKPKGYAGLAAMLQLCLDRLGVRMPPLFLDTDDWEGKGGMNETQDYSFAEKWLYVLQERWLPCRARGVTVASRMLEQLISGMGLDRKCMLYMPNCVDGSREGNGVSVRGRLGIPQSAPVLLLYTRFFEFDQEKLHQVLAAIFCQVPGVRFLVVGKGRRGEEVQLLEASRRLGFDGAVTMAGWIEPLELPGYLAAADMALYPFADTLINRAKCPAKLTEILLAGVPVVADGVGQIPEYVAPQLHFLLCNPDDWGCMVAKSVQLLRDPGLRRHVSSLGREYIIENFNWNDYSRRLDGFYRSLLV